jgi:hypothetical protein
MKRLSLTVLACILVIGGIVAWFVDPTRKVDWIPVFLLGIVVSVVDGRIRELEKRLDAQTLGTPKA